jgi:hypothetical protein
LKAQLMMARGAGRITGVCAAVGLAAIVCASCVGLAKGEGAPPFVPFPPGAPPAACGQHPGTTLRQSGSVVVYGTGAGTNPLGQTRTRFWACTLPDGASTPLGERASGGRYPANATMRRVTIAGSYVAAVESSGAGAAARCVARDGHFCHRPDRTVMLVNAALGGSSGSDIHATVGRLLVGASGPTGAVVYTQPASRGRIVLSWDVMTVKGAGTQGGGFSLIGAVDPRSLSLHGLRLRYTEHGQTHSVNLGRAL